MSDSVQDYRLAIPIISRSLLHDTEPRPDFLADMCATGWFDKPEVENPEGRRQGLGESLSAVEEAAYVHTQNLF